MRHLRRTIPLALALVFGLTLWFTKTNAQRNGSPALEGAMQLYKDGNYNDAYSDLRALALDESTPSAEMATVIDTAISCLQQLNRADEIEAFREDADGFPDRDDILVVTHWGFIRCLTGAEVGNLAAVRLSFQP